MREGADGLRIASAWIWAEGTSTHIQAVLRTDVSDPLGFATLTLQPPDRP
jgi:hypothetical protein